MAKLEAEKVPVFDAEQLAAAVKEDLVPIFDGKGDALSELSVFKEAHSLLNMKLIASLQTYLDDLEGTHLNDEAEMRSFADKLQGMLDSLGGLRINATAQD